MGIPRIKVEHLLGRKLDKPKSSIPKSIYRSQAEADYAARLWAMEKRGEIISWFYEPVKFNIGTWYIPDFMVIRLRQFIDRGEITTAYFFEFHEVKRPHRFRERGIVKFKAAQKTYPWFKWVLVEA